jgi:tetratricopeptide (TPR) repeat protein
MNAAACRLSLIFLLLAAQTHAKAEAPAPAAERLGTVSFAISCAQKVRAPFNRGVALLHDFWYEAAERQFAQIAIADPHCAMAHWGIAMSLFQQIWDRPGDQERSRAWAELEGAKNSPARSARERAYVAALSEMFRPGPAEFQARADAYSASMAALYQRYPDDVDAGAFYALSLLAAEPVGDLSLKSERKALAVLKPLFIRCPDHPGVAHYIIHASDSPALAAEGLPAAQRYGQIAPSAPHAAHMPGHIFARLGMWQADIDANLASVEAAHLAEARHESGTMYLFHSNDFLLYAYLQAGQEARAKDISASTAELIAQVAAMPSMIDASMLESMPFYRAEFPVMLDLELRDWKSAAALEPPPEGLEGVKMFIRWARAIAAGHMHEGAQAAAELAAYEELLGEFAHGKQGYMAKSNAFVIMHGEVQAWAAFAQGESANALKKMRESADLQDRVGQGEVDIPAREMLADMLLDLGQASEALAEYQRALELSPRRFNALFNAGMAAEASHGDAEAAQYYRKLLQSTGGGAQSTRSEFVHIKDFLAANP